MTSERTLQSVVDWLGEHGRKTALVVFGKKDRHHWSFQKLAACALSFANGLVKYDFKRGDTIAIFSENSPESIASVLGIIRAGMVAVPLDVQLGDKTLSHTLQDSDARAIITRAPPMSTMPSQSLSRRRRNTSRRALAIVIWRKRDMLDGCGSIRAGGSRCLRARRSAGGSRPCLSQDRLGRRRRHARTLPGCAGNCCSSS